MIYVCCRICCTGYHRASPADVTHWLDAHYAYSHPFWWWLHARN